MSSFDRFILWIAEGFGLGRIRPAPGTWGSLLGLPIGWALATTNASWWMCLLVGAVMFVVGVPICAKGAELRNTKDPGSVVWDEFAAFPIVYAFAPLTPDHRWTVLFAGFALFRIFDIWKPPPVRQCDQMTGGLGIMMDDTIAAVYAAAFLWLLATYVL